MKSVFALARKDLRLLFRVRSGMFFTFVWPVVVAVLFGPRINGARRWFGVAGVGVQPSEFAKLAIIFFVAAILERRMDRIVDQLVELFCVHPADHPGLKVRYAGSGGTPLVACARRTTARTARSWLPAPGVTGRAD